MMQESVYCKLVLNASANQAVLANLYKTQTPQILGEKMIIR